MQLSTHKFTDYNDYKDDRKLKFCPMKQRINITYLLKLNCNNDDF